MLLLAKLSKYEQDRRRRERKQAAASPARRRMLIVGLAAALAVGAVLVFQAGRDQAACPGHWHATVAVYVEGERVTFPQPPYNFEREGGRHQVALHMHRPDQEQLHFEPAVPRCTGLEQAMRHLDVELDADAIELKGAHADAPYGGRHVEEGDKVLRVVLQAPGEPRREVEPGDVLDDQLVDGERALILFGTYTDTEVEDLFSQLSVPTG